MKNLKELTTSSKFHYITQRLQALSLLGIKELMATAVRDLKAITSTAERKANGNFQHFLAQCGKRKCKPLRVLKSSESLEAKINVQMKRSK